MQKSKARCYIKHGTLTQLRVFEAVTRLGSYTRAAEELFMAQPTVSVQVKKLTQTIGMPLFEHVGKRVHATAAGRELCAACREIFQTLENVENKLTNMRDLKSGRLRLATSVSGKYFTTEMLADFARQHPGIDVALHVHHRTDLLQRLASNTDDLYILSNPPEDGKTVKQVIFRNPLFVYARADHPLANVKRSPFECLATEPFLMREAGSGTRMVVEQTFTEHGVAPSIRMELGNDDAIKHAIVAGLGVSILSRYALAHGSNDGQLVALDIAGFPLLRSWYSVYPAGKQPSLLTQTFIAFVRDNAGGYERKSDRTDRWREAKQ